MTDNTTSSTPTPEPAPRSAAATPAMPLPQDAAAATPPPVLPPPPPAAPTGPPAVASPPPPRPKKKMSGCLIAFLVVVAILVLGGIGFVVAIYTVLGDGEKFLGNKNSRIREEVVPGEFTGADKIAVIDVKGLITAGSYYDGAGADAICEALRAASEDKNIKAIVLDMDTPGGEITASDEVHRAVLEARRANKPVVTCMHALGASGGYYIAAATDYIIANRLTFTGSIGVIIPGLNYSGLFEKLGLQSESYKSGAMKDMLSGSRERTPQEIEYVNALVQEAFREFATIVAEGRPAFRHNVDNVLKAPFADGRVMSGRMAKDFGLIDAFGGFDDAVTKARELGSAPTAKVVRLRRSFSFAEMLFSAQKNMKLHAGLPLPEEWSRVKYGQGYYLMPGYLP